MPDCPNRIRGAFDASLSAAAPSLCDAVETRLVAYLTALPRAFTQSPLASFAIAHAPVAPGALAVTLPPPVLPVYIDSREVLLGPPYAPGQSVCPECLDYWLTLNDFARDKPDLVCLRESLARLADSLGRWTSEGGSRAILSCDHAVAIGLSDGQVTYHPVFPRRDCVRCRGVSRDALPLTAHCSRRTGIITRMELTASPSAGAHRATASWISPLPVAGARAHLARQDSYGRGRTPDQARQSCIGEALERYSLIYRGDERLAARARIGEVDALHPDDIQLFSAAQYAGRDEWNASVEDEWFVPERFDPDVPVDWLEARALNQGAQCRLVPAACCLMWYPFRSGEPEFARADTIGCASGLTFDDALTRALLEWVERDAMAIWWDNRLERPGLRIESFDSADLETVRDGLKAVGRDLFILDCTTDVGIPAYVAVAPRFDGSEPLLASAADPSPRVAAYRASSEAGQVWHEALRSKALPRVLKSWLLHETVAEQPYLRPRGFVDAPTSFAGQGDQPLWKFVVDRLEAVGLGSYAVDHSRPDVVPRTVRAVVPGLRHVWNRRAPGRLYDVPVRLGWLERPRAEGDLNPVPGML